MTVEKGTALSPIEKKRAALLKSMSPACREVAEDFSQKLTKASQGVVLISYDMGARVRQVREDVAQYGSNAIEVLGAYLGISATALYSLHGFANAFEREFVRENSSRVLPDGTHLSLGHWTAISKISENKDRLRMLNRVFRESLSANAVEREVKAAEKKTNRRSGGRKPSVPTSVLAGVQQTLSLGKKFNNLEPLLIEQVFDKIDVMAPDQVNDVLLTKLGECKEALEALTTNSATLLKRVNSGITRVNRVLDAKASQPAAAEGDDHKPEPETETVPVRPKKTKAKGGKKSKKSNKPSKKPAAV